MLNISEKLTNSQFINIIKLAGKVGFNMGIKTYIVGGYLRDIMLERKLTDIDIMVEDNVIEFSNNLAINCKP